MKKARRTALTIVKPAKKAAPAPEPFDAMAADFADYESETFEQRLDRLDRISSQLITMAESDNVPAHVRERLALLNAAKGIMSTLHYIRKGTDDDGPDVEAGSAVRRYSEAFQLDADRRGGQGTGRAREGDDDGGESDIAADPAPDAA